MLPSTRLASEALMQSRRTSHPAAWSGGYVSYTPVKHVEEAHFLTSILEIELTSNAQADFSCSGWQHHSASGRLASIFLISFPLPFAACCSRLCRSEAISMYKVFLSSPAAAIWPKISLQKRCEFVTACVPLQVDAILICSSGDRGLARRLVPCSRCRQLTCAWSESPCRSSSRPWQEPLVCSGAQPLMAASIKLTS